MGVRGLAWLMLVGIGSLAVASETDASASAAAANAPLQVQLERRKVQIASGREILAPAEIAKPGDVLQETATYSNRSASALAGVEATLPVPQNTQLIVDSIKPSTARASLDGITFSPVPLRRKVKLADGTMKEQSVHPREYRYLRWYPGNLGPQQSVSFVARFRVNDNAADVADAAGNTNSTKR
jgi:hypothetical protein